MRKPTLGSIVGGKYKLLRPLGEGGMGTVYEVEHTLTHKRAAIKWVHPQLGSSDSAYDRLLHEARATSRIHHRNVVDVYDVVREDDAVCLVMELLIGEPLSERIARSPIPFTELVALLVAAMRGVSAAHAAGVIHRDIKPDNIFLSSEPGQPEIVPKVIDFGISKIFDSTSESPQTRSGVTMGTPKYVSYEQLLGARDVDGRADVYAFGVILYEALTGEPPYRASTFGEQAVAFAMSVPERPSVLRPEVPPALDVLVYRAIAKERDQRIGSIETLIAELEPFLEARGYPTPLLAFVQNPARQPGGSAGANDPTTPAVGNPGAAPCEPVREIGRLPSTPQGSVQVAAPTLSELSRRDSQSRLARAAVLVGALGVLTLLVWWFQVPRHHPGVLPAARAESAPQSTLSELAPSPSRPAPASLKLASPPADVASMPEMTSVPPSARSVRAQAEPPRRAPRSNEAEASHRERRRLRRATPRPPVFARPRAPAPTKTSSAAPAVETSPSLVASEPTSSETHRAGRLARDEF